MCVKHLKKTVNGNRKSTSNSEVSAMLNRLYTRFALLSAFIGLCLYTVMEGTVAHAQSVDHIKLLPASTKTEITLFVSDIATPPHVFVLDGGNPRVVVDFAKAESRFNKRKSLPGAGHIKTIRHAKRGDAGIRVVFDLKDGGNLLSKTIKTDEIVLVIAGPPLKKAELTGAAGVKQITYTPDTRQKSVQKSDGRYFTNAIPYPRLQPRLNTQIRRKPVIVIDAGHGGHDPGALGQQKTKEKIITLSAAKELQKQLEKTGRYKVVLTRSSDVYIEHEDRLRLAREGLADLFISIHADATRGSQARGASVYTLSDQAKRRSREIVDSQNWIMDVNLEEQSDPVGDILVDLAQRKTLSQSAQFANILIKDLSKTTRLVGNSHRRAGYFVLLAPDVPAVLLELGFLSNASDETLLRSAKHRQKLMRSVTRSINRYFDRTGA